PSPASGLVNTTGSPPSADTRQRPVSRSVVANTIVLSSAQLAPSEAPITGPSVTAEPPVTGTFLISPFSKKPIHRLSGEKNGEYALVISASGRASSGSIATPKTGP